MALLGNLLRGRGVRPEGRDDAYEMGEDDSTVFDPTANDISNHPLFPYWKEITSVDKGDFLGEVEIVGNNARYNQLKITPGSAYDYLGEGETTTAELTYTFRNGWGTWHEASIFLTIIGENDAVTITAADEDGAVIELADGNPGEGSANLTDSGMISFTDPDLTDTHTATVTGSSSSNGTVLGMLSFAVTDDPMAAAGSVEWTYSVADGAVEFLGAGETVTETFTIEISDDFGGADTATVTVTVTGTNDGVVVTSSVLAGAVTEIADEAPGEGVEPLMAIGLIEFSDLDLTDTHTVSVTGSSSTNGAVLGGLSLALTDSTGTGAGSVEWTYSVADAAIEFLGEGETVTETFTVTIDDQKGGEAFESVTVTITGTNDAPVVQALTGTVSEDGPAIALTASFTDLDATDTHTITSDDSLTTGVVTDDGMGGFTYDPNGAFEALDDNETATDSFTYTVDDGNGGVVTETVTFTIEGVNDAPVAADDTGLPSPDPIHEDAVHVIDTADLLANDSDVDGDVLTVTATDAVSDLGAGVTLNPDGTISYDPTGVLDYLAEGETVTDSFTYTVSDGDLTDTATVSFTVNGLNDAPVAMDDAVGTGFGAGSRITAQGSEIGVTDIAADRYRPSAAPLSDGGFVVTWETFGLDGNTNSVFAQLYDADGAAVGSRIRISSDAAGDQILVSATGLPDGGFVTSWLHNGVVRARHFDASGSPTGDEFEVTAPGAGQVYAPQVMGLADGDYVIVWQERSADDQTPHIFAQRFEVSGAPVGLAFGVAQETNVIQSSPTVQALPDGGYVVTWSSGGVLKGQIFGPSGDAVADAFTISSFGANAHHASIALLDDGGFIVAWAAKINDIHPDDLDIFAQRFNAAGQPVDGQFQINTATQGREAYANAVDLPGGGFLVTWTSIDFDSFAADVYGQVFDAAGNRVGEEFRVHDADTFYDAQDAENGAPGTITLEDGTIAAIFIASGNIKVRLFDQVIVEDEAAVIRAADLLANDSDVDASDTLCIVAVSNSALGATVSINGDGDIVYNPAGALDYLAEGETVTDSFTYTVDDGHGGSDTATVTLTVHGINDAAVIGGDFSINLDETDDLVTHFGQFTVSDPDTGEDAFVAQVTSETHGDFTLLSDGHWAYTTALPFDELNVGDTVSDSFTIETLDGTTQTVTITLNGTNDAAFIGGDLSGSVNETDTPVTITGTLTATDVDNDDNSFIAQTGVAGTYGAFSIGTDGNWTFTASSAFDELAAGDSHSESFAVQSVDGTMASVTVTINGTNDAPVAGDDVLEPLTTVSDLDTLSGSGFLNVLWFGEDSNHRGDAQRYVAQTFTATGEQLDQIEFKLSYADGYSDQNFVVLVTEVGGVGEDFVPGDILFESAVQTLPISGPGSFAIDTEGLVLEYGQRYAVILDAGRFYDNGEDFSFLWVASGSADTDNQMYSASPTSNPDADLVTPGWHTYSEYDLGLRLDFSTREFTEDAQRVIDTSDLLANDFDAEGDTLSISAVDNGGSGGAVSLNGDGDVVYDPNGAFDYLQVGETATDSFTYTVSDGDLTDTATVSFTVKGVNDAPTVGGAGASANVSELLPPAQNTAPYVTSGSFGFADVDLSDTHTVSVTAQGSGYFGSLTAALSADSTGTGSGGITWTFSVDEGALDGLDEGETSVQSYLVTVDDGEGGTASETVTITLNGAEEAQLLTGFATGTDPDVVNSENWAFVSVDHVTEPSGGSHDWYRIDITEDGTNVVFDIDHAYEEGGSFDAFIALYSSTNQLVAHNDDATAEDPGSQPSTPHRDSYLVTTLDIGTYYLDVGRYNGNGPEFIESLPQGATYELQVSKNVPTVIGGDLNVAKDETDNDLSFAGTLSAVDPDGPDNSFDAPIPFGYSEQGDYGSFNFKADGSWTYRASSALNHLDTGEFVTDSFTVSSVDGTTATVTITINGTNDAPVAQDDVAGPVTTEVGLNSLDGAVVSDSGAARAYFAQTFVATGEALSLIEFDIQTDVAFSVLVTTVDGDGSFNPDQILFETVVGTNGASVDTTGLSLNAGQTYAFVVSYSNGMTTNSVAFADVTAIADGDLYFMLPSDAAYDYATDFPSGNWSPVSADLGLRLTYDVQILTDEDTAATILADDLLDNDFDVEGDTLSISAVSATSAAGAAVSLNGDGDVVYDPLGAFDYLQVGETATDTFTYTVSDGALTDTATVTVTIEGVNDAPEAADDIVYGAQSSQLTTFAGSNNTPFGFTTSYVAQTFTATDDILSSVGFDMAEDPSGPDYELRMFVTTINGDGTFNADVLFESDPFELPEVSGGLAANTIDTGGIAVTQGETYAVIFEFTSLGGSDGIVGRQNVNGNNLYADGQYYRLTGTPSGDLAADFANLANGGLGGNFDLALTLSYDDPASTDEDTAITILTDDLLANDFDIEGDALSVSGFASDGAVSGTSTLGARLVLDTGTGEITYDPRASETLQMMQDGDSMTDSFTYTVSDGQGGTDTATVTLLVDGRGGVPNLVLDFEDVDVGAVLIADLPSGYHGFDWPDDEAVYGDWIVENSSGAYGEGVVSGEQALFGKGASDIEFTRDTDFDFLSGWFTAAHYDGLEVTVQAYDDGVLTATEVFSVNTEAATFHDFSGPGFESVDRVVISSGEFSQLAVDDLSFVV